MGEAVSASITLATRLLEDHGVKLARLVMQVARDNLCYESPHCCAPVLANRLAMEVNTFMVTIDSSFAEFFQGFASELSRSEARKNLASNS